MRFQLVAGSQRLAPSPLSALLLCRLVYFSVDRIALHLVLRTKSSLSEFVLHLASFVGVFDVGPGGVSGFWRIFARYDEFAFRGGLVGAGLLALGHASSDGVALGSGSLAR